MNIGIIGSGGREHSICFKLRKSKKINNLYCIPGNAGTSEICENLEVDINNFNELYKIILDKKIELLVVGPEEPLVNGITNFFEEKKIKVFGPSKKASMLEGSKAFMKKMCKDFSIPSAKFREIQNFNEIDSVIEKFNLPIVVKSDGLAGGKGVVICNTKQQAIKETEDILKGKFKSSKKVIIEEFLKGQEASYFIITDGENYIPIGTAQDHKRIGENDTGPNTGGMGAYSPSFLISNEVEEKIKKKIIEPTLKAMKDYGHPYKGFLYAGLMVKNDEPYLIEYNIRMGDPECQALMMRLQTDLAEIIDHTIKNKINEIKIKWSKKNSITIVLCAKGYPSNYVKNSEIKYLSNIILDENNQIFHAGTYEKNNKTFSNGGRGLNIKTCAKNFLEAKNKALVNIKKISWKDGFFRKDIAWRVIK